MWRAASRFEPAPLIVQAENASRAYGQTNPPFAALITGFANGDTTNVLSGQWELSCSAQPTSPQGTYPIVAAGNLTATNYSITYSNGTLSVATYTLVVTAANQIRPYGGTNPVFTGTLVGIQSGDNITATYSTTAGVQSGVGTYAIVPTLNDPNGKLPNYGVTLHNGTLTITPAALTVAASNASRAYGATNPALGGTLSGLVNGDSITASYSTTATAQSGVGTYAIVPTLNDPNSKLSNYTPTVQNGTLTVTAAPLLGQADNKSRLYGQGNPPLTLTYTGFVNGDNSSVLSGTLSASTTAQTNSPVGAYPILFTGQHAANYSVAYVAGSLGIEPAPLIVQAENASRAYGQTNPPFAALITGFANGDTTNVLSGQWELSCSAQPTSPQGTYPIVAAGNLTATNYSITYSNGTLSVATYTLVVTAANQTRPYGGTNPVFTGTLVGLQSGDNITATYSTTAGVQSGVGTYAIVPTLNDPNGKLPNYGVTLQNGTLTITPATLTVAAANASRAYGATNPALGGTLSGLVNGDSITASYSTTAAARSSVGIYAIVPSLNDPKSKLSNYTPTLQNGTLTVTAAPLVGRADNKSRLYGQGNPPLTLSYTGFVNGDNSSLLSGTLSGSTSAQTNSPVGAYPIQFTGQSTANYSITYVAGILTVEPAPLVVQAENVSRRLRPDQPGVRRLVQRLRQWRWNQCAERAMGFYLSGSAQQYSGHLFHPGRGQPERHQL